MTDINNIINQFPFEGEFIKADVLTDGHINSTYKVSYKQADGSIKNYILQKINTFVFKQPVELMENISNVTAHIRKRYEQEGKDTSRCTLTIVPAKDGNLFYRDEEDNYIRSYTFIENSIGYHKVEHPSQFYNAGVALGMFQKQLEDYPADKLHITIPRFHDTRNRFNNFLKALEENAASKANLCSDTIEFAKSREYLCDKILDQMAEGNIPVRVTHNDTKLNNVLLDRDSEEVLCLIDLDTVMPGSALFDFGDSIRFGASSAAEDETDLDKVYMDMELFKAYTKGYLKESASFLTQAEIDDLALSAVIITYEIGLRFLTDHLEGDVYFHIDRPDHNLERARNQFKLVKDMEEKLEEMKAYVRSCTV